MPRLFSLPYLALHTLAAGFLLTTAAPAAAQTIPVTVQPGDPKVVISKHIYGHFAEHLGRCIYDGFWVDEKLNVPKQGRIRMDIVEALRKIKVPNLRWPGGCFADSYHWRDGVGPTAQRPATINSWWGDVVEDNSFGTHEFLELCKLLGAEPYLAANVGSGTVQEMATWMEYLNSNADTPLTQQRRQNGHPAPYGVTWWGIGNESWGCGGNMTADYYTDVYKRYATFARNHPGSPPLKRIVSGANGDDANWTETCMKKIPLDQMWGLTLHQYTLPTGSWTGSKGKATGFTEAQYFNTVRNCLKMDDIVTRHAAIMDKYDPQKKVALLVDEWGVWTDVEPGTNPGFLFQQNSLRDALVAATTLNIFNNHSDRVRGANLAQAVNVLQALVLTDKEKMLLTPTYHVFDLYQVHQDAQWLPLQFRSPDYVLNGEKLPALNASASKDASGTVHVSLVNLDTKKTLKLEAALPGVNWKTVSGRILTSANVNDHNTFASPSKVQLATFNGARKRSGNLAVELPPQSVVVLALQ
ncbi:alpha-N-arabinofuranosidase [Hymenobacter psychrotolerans]|uniref:non-reducing end alpha-L-arabinofuranosidase n=1 Tax=Hymenobacter psychrotolerans DSM 18569 TaxID=1121959 RepID=A0A1M7DQR1_9BACT|nr:alpha-L-arabinofuranosidase C-terminal domain-containing protein [Hymenobacter psychrotolerans]SHL81830.1 alpha-N-arabinofuranosidase [Hymenobacter psychrotolerans DSM 18569]